MFGNTWAMEVVSCLWRFIQKLQYYQNCWYRSLQWPWLLLKKLDIAHSWIKEVLKRLEIVHLLEVINIKPNEVFGVLLVITSASAHNNYWHTKWEHCLSELQSIYVHWATLTPMKVSNTHKRWEGISPGLRDSTWGYSFWRGHYCALSPCPCVGLCCAHYHHRSSGSGGVYCINPSSKQLNIRTRTHYLECIR